MTLVRTSPPSSPVSDRSITTSPKSSPQSETCSPMVHSSDIPTRITLFPDLSRLELHFVDVMLHKQLQVDKFLLGPSFRDQHLQAFADQLGVGPFLVRDAFIACASLLAGNTQVESLARDQQVGFRRAASAVATLRRSRPGRDDDPTLVLIMGVALVTFALHHATGDPLPLCQHFLQLFKSFHRDIWSLNENTIAFLICLLGTEIEECLILCREPTLDIRFDLHYQGVDRCMGISAPMLSYFHGICVVAQDIRRGNEDTRHRQRAKLQEIETNIVQWEPFTREFSDRHYSSGEVELIFAQARAMRCAGLLIIHRLQHPYGTKDAKAQPLSDTILGDLDAVFESTSRSFPFCELPHAVACLEIQDVAKRKTQLENSHRFVDFSVHVRNTHKQLLVNFWLARDLSPGEIYWDHVQSSI